MQALYQLSYGPMCGVAASDSSCTATLEARFALWA